MKKRYIALALALMLALLTASARAEETTGALMLTYEQEARHIKLWLPDEAYDWQNDPEGLMAQLMDMRTPTCVERLDEQPCAVTQIGLNDTESTGVQLVGDLTDYTCAARKVARALGQELPEGCTLRQALTVLLGEETQTPALMDVVPMADWTRLSSRLWNECSTIAAAQEQAALTYGALYAALMKALPDGEVRASLSGFQAAFEARGERCVSWAELLCVLPEALTAQWDELPYLVFCGEEQRLKLHGEQPTYRVTLYVDGALYQVQNVPEGMNAECPHLPGVTWVGKSERIMADTILNGYTARRVTFCLTNADAFAELMGDVPAQWEQKVLYDHRLRPSSHYMELLAERGLQVSWPQAVGRRVHDDLTVEGTLSLLLPPDSATPEPTATVRPSDTPEPTATAAPMYTVTFVFPPELDYPEGEAAVQVQVQAGQAAIPPAVDESRLDEHYTFAWPDDWKNVTQDLTITGLLTPKNYTVRLRVLGELGEELYRQEQTQAYGSALTLPVIELTAGQKVVWDSLPALVTGDCEIVGHVQAIEPIVTYRLMDLNGALTELGSEKVAYGGNATLPAVQIPEGCEITWNGTLSNLTADTVVTGVISLRQYTVVITILNPDGSVYFSQAQTVAYGNSADAPAFTVPEGFTFAWEEGTNFENVTDNRAITGRLTASVD